MSNSHGKISKAEINLVIMVSIKILGQTPCPSVMQIKHYNNDALYNNRV